MRLQLSKLHAAKMPPAYEQRFARGKTPFDFFVCGSHFKATFSILFQISYKILDINLH